MLIGVVHNFLIHQLLREDMVFPSIDEALQHIWVPPVSLKHPCKPYACLHRSQKRQCIVLTLVSLHLCCPVTSIHCLKDLIQVLLYHLHWNILHRFDCLFQNVVKSDRSIPNAYQSHYPFTPIKVKVCARNVCPIGMENED